MSVDEFEAAIESAKKLEKKIMEYSPYEGNIELEQTMDMEPAEYVDLSYKDLANEYIRAQKILSTRSMGIYATGKREGAKVSAESAEVENKLRAMTDRTLKQVEKVAEEAEIELEKPVQAEPEPLAGPEIPPIEFEKETADSTPPIEFEKEPTPEIELEKPVEKKPKEIEVPEPIKMEEPEQITPEEPAEAPKPGLPKKPAPEVEVPLQPETKAAPPALRGKTPAQAADERYQRMEEQIRATLGQKPDELTLKKKMLELTKQLFKEKSHNRRAEIKVQITVLKNMLVQVKEGKAVGKGRKDDTYSNLFQTMLSTQQAEVAQTKDKIVNTYNEKVEEIKKRFYEELSVADEPAKRKEVYEKFVFNVTQLVEQLPGVVKEQEEFARKKHVAELEKLIQSVKNKDKKTLGLVEERMAYVSDSYTKEFGSVKRIVGGQIDTLIEVTGADIFKEPTAEEKADKAAKDREIVKEINDTDEGTLLYFLHSNDSDYYRKYERKQISKAEAISKAKALMAKDRGLGDAAVKKYFNQEDD
jgi:hypothetical protein